jgi:hypothetical protein
MTWIQFGLLALLNFASVFAAVWIFKIIENQRRLKAIESFIDHVEEKISTEMNFQDLVKRFEEGERNND